MTLLGVLVAAGLALAGAAPASAAPLPFDATLTLQIGGLGTVTSNGAGTGDFSGPGGAASIPAGVFTVHASLPLSPPLLVIDGFAVGAPGVPTGAAAPVPPGSSKALAFGGVTGTMGLNAAAYLLTGVVSSPPGFVAAGIPLGLIGVGGTQMQPPLGMLIMGTIFPNPYQLGMVTLMGALNGVPSAVVGTGFDNRTAGGAGVLQLVSPNIIGLGALGAVTALATLSITIVPEPTTVLLVGAGLAALAAGRRRFSSHDTRTNPT
jgi:hypothetical protein